MKAAFSCWNGRIAPVFDVAAQVHLVQAEAGQVLSRREETLPAGPAVLRAACLAQLGVDTLVCGAISRPLQALVESYGIRVIPFLAGGLEQVTAAWLADALEDRALAMPGCCGRSRRQGRPGGRGPRVCPQCGQCVPACRGVSNAGSSCPACGAALAGQ